MSISAQCPSCQAAYSLPDDFGGKTVRCAKCKHQFVLPPSLSLEEKVTAAPPAPAPAIDPAIFPAQPPEAIPFAVPVPSSPSPQPPAPVKKSGRAPVLLIVGGTLGGIFLLCGGGCVISLGVLLSLRTTPTPGSAGPVAVNSAPHEGPGPIVEQRPQPGNPPEPPREAPVPPIQLEPPKAPGLETLKPPVPVTIKPAPLDQERVVKTLPSTIGDVAVGGGGRYLILSLPQAQQLAIFDVNAAQVVKYLKIDDDIRFAAGMNKLFVASSSGNLTRYNLSTLEREVTVSMPLQGAPTSACMGSASNGPLLLQTRIGDGALAGMGIAFVNPDTLKTIEPHWLRGGTMPGYTPNLIRASANGRIFGLHAGLGGEPHIMKCVVLAGSTATVTEVWPNYSLVVPGPDGRFLYSSDGVLTTELKPVSARPQRAPPGHAGPYLPAEQGTYFLQLQTTSQEGQGDVAFFISGLSGSFAKLSNVEGVFQERIHYGSPQDSITHDKRVHFIPDAKLLVTIPPTNDKLLLYRFDPEQALEKSELDYLIITSQPPPARKGQLFSYAMVVRSRRGGVKYRLETGPKGMAIDGAGKVIWNVPAEPSEAESDVIISVSDSTGQEVFHTFKVAPSN